MVSLSSLLLPIFLSAVVVFLLSAVVWMVLPHHRTDFRGIVDEESVRNVLRAQNLAPAQYSIPHASGMKAMSSDEHQRKMKEGPVAILLVMPNQVPAMGKSLGIWFVYSLAISIAVAYVTGRALPPGAGFAEVFRYAGTTGILAYATALLQTGIWLGRPWGPVLKEFLDGVLYGLGSGLVFAVLWPGM